MAESGTKSRTKSGSESIAKFGTKSMAESGTKSRTKSGTNLTVKFTTESMDKLTVK
jgi:hypothetical protein